MKRRSADATKCVHAGEDRHGESAPLTTPITQTSVFVVPGLAELRRYAAGDRDFYLYARYSTPTVKAAEDKIAALEGAEAAVITSSGMSAILVAALASCEAGDEIVSMLDIYGGTVKLFENVLGRCGIESRFIPYTISTRRSAISPARRACCFWKLRRIRRCAAPTLQRSLRSLIVTRRAWWSTTRSQPRSCRSRSNWARTS